jgi:hypothetical protein
LQEAAGRDRGMSFYASIVEIHDALVDIHVADPSMATTAADAFMTVAEGFVLTVTPDRRSDGFARA